MYLFYDEQNNVNLIYYVELPPELVNTPHFEVESLLELVEPEGMQAILKCDGKKVWYDYVDKVLSPEELLKQQFDALVLEQEMTNDLLQEIILRMYL